jgi:hypothetical protein
MPALTNEEGKRKESLELMIKTVQAAPEAFKGKTDSVDQFANELILGAKAIYGYLFKDQG